MKSQPFAQHLPDARDLGLLDLAEAVARGLEVGLDEKRRVIHHRRQDRRDRDLLVGICRKSAITNATAPMTGGMSWPPFEAQASTAPASRGDMPERFISGIVTMPTDRVRRSDAGNHAEQARADDRHLRRAAAVAARAIAASLKKFEPPERIKSWPISTNGMITITVICSTRPSSPLLSRLR